MITAEAAHSIAIKVRDGQDSDAGQLLEKINEIITVRARQGMWWAYIHYDDFFRDLSDQEIKWVKLRLEKLGYAVTDYKQGCWGIAW